MQGQHDLHTQLQSSINGVKKHWRLPAGIPNGMRSSATARGSNSSVRSKSGFAIQRFVLDKQTSGNTWLFLASKFGSDKGTISKLKAVLSTTSWPCWGCPGKKFSFISTPFNSSEFLRSSVKSWGAPGPPIPTTWKGQAPAWKPFLRLKLWRNLHNIIIHGCDKPTNWISLETFYLEEPNVQSLVSSILIANLFSSCGRCIAFAHSAMWPRSSEGVWTFWTRERWRASLPKHWSTSSWECPVRRKRNEALSRFLQLTCAAAHLSTWLFFTSLQVLSACTMSRYSPRFRPYSRFNNVIAWANGSTLAFESFWQSGLLRHQIMKYPCTIVNETCSFGFCIIDRSFPFIKGLLGRLTFPWSMPSWIIVIILRSFWRENERAL